MEGKGKKRSWACSDSRYCNTGRHVYRLSEIHGNFLLANER